MNISLPAVEADIYNRCDVLLTYNHRLNLRKWCQLLQKELIIDNPVNAIQPAHIFQLNIMHAWMILLLCPFYEPHLQKLAVSANDGVAAECSPMRGNEYLKEIYRLANEECPNTAGHMLDLFRAYDKLFTLRPPPLTNVQLAYVAGKTLMHTVSAGGYGEIHKPVLRPARRCGNVQNYCER